MVTVALKVWLELPGVSSLKEKRRILKSLFADLRRAFNVSIAEVGDNDSPRRALLGAAVVSNETRYGHQVVSQAVNKLENRPDLLVIDYQMETY